jgi:hypothetical protein
MGCLGQIILSQKLCKFESYVNVHVKAEQRKNKLRTISPVCKQHKTNCAQLAMSVNSTKQTAHNQPCL